MYVCMCCVRHETKRYSMDGEGIGRDFRKGGGGGAVGGGFFFMYVFLVAARPARRIQGVEGGGRAGDDYILYYNLIMPCMGMGLGLGAWAPDVYIICIMYCTYICIFLLREGVGLILLWLIIYYCK